MAESKSDYFTSDIKPHSVDRATEIVDHHLGVFARRRERNLAAYAAPGPGDDDDFPPRALPIALSSPTSPLRGLPRRLHWRPQRVTRANSE